jgi:hypothetical protein
MLKYTLEPVAAVVGRATIEKGAGPENEESPPYVAQEATAEC